MAYVPPLWSAPGRVGADTKSYLYLDPGRLLARAPYLWDHHIGFGTVSHQTIGYLWPMGPWFWAFDRLGVPDWIAQRLWLGTVLFAAGAGVLFLLRTISRPGTWSAGGWSVAAWSAPTRFVAASAYALSPYVLDYAARISVILLPWAGLPWLVALAVRAARQGGWRWPAGFALVVVTVGSVNATALVLAGLGPLVWLAVIVLERDLPWRSALAAVARIAVLCLGVSLWWMAGLWAQGRYGIPILRYTETYEAVTRTATAPELLRGLGYWFFYGNDKLGPWIEAGAHYTHPLLVAVGYALVAAALLAAALARGRHRRPAVALVVVGLAVAVGSHPWEAPTLYGRVWKAFVATTPGGALRSTPRAVPLVVLGLALLLASGVEAVGRRWAASGRRRWRPAVVLVPVAAAALVAVNQLPLFTGSLYGENLQRPESLPAYWPQAAAAMGAGGDATRVLELPGTDFASYRWGNTVDPVTPGLTDRDYVARELIPYGSAPSADLLGALDRRFQEGVPEPAAVAPIARLAGIGTVALRADLQYERYRTPRPRQMWAELGAAPGLGEPQGFGDPVPNRAIARLPLIDEIELGLPAGSADPPPVALFPVEGARPEVRADTGSTAPIVYAGDGEGMVDMAAAGLLDDVDVVVPVAGLAARPDVLAATLGGTAPAHLVVTDTNRRAARRWGTVRENQGYTEVAGEEPLVDDPSDNRLDVYPDAEGDEHRTVAELGGAGVAAVQATAYGNPVSYTAENRPANGLDGDPQTAWRVGAFADVRGERLEVTYDGPVTTDTIRLLQPINGPRNRFMTQVRLRFDDAGALDVDLDDTSRAEPGQVIPLGQARTFRRLSVEVRAADRPSQPRYDGVSGVGIAELDVGGRRADEVLRLPTDLLSVDGAAGPEQQVTVVVTRQRADPAEPVRSDPETHLARRFTLPAERTFTVGGTARLSAAAPVPVLAGALGPEAGAGAAAVTADATASLPGDLRAGPGAAIDGDPATSWTTPFVFAVGSATTYTTPAPVTFDHLDLVAVDDGRHSWPTELTVTPDGGAPVGAAVPARETAPLEPTTPPGTVPERAGEQAVRRVRVELPAPVTATTLTLAITGIDPVEVNDYYSETPVATPVAIAEWGVPGLATAPVDDAAPLPGACRSDLLTVDDAPVPVRLVGTTGAALDRDGLAVEGCGDPLRLGAGEHEVRTALGRVTGIDLDRLVLDSPAAVPPAATTPSAAPVLTVTGQGAVGYDGRVTGTGGQPFWVVLGQSHNDGWRLEVEGADQGAPVLVDGFANGWLVTPTAGADPLSVRLRWTPQRVVWVGLAASAAAVLLCLVLALFGRSVETSGPQTTPTRHRARRWPPWLGPVVVTLGFGVVAGPFTGVAAGATAALVRARPGAARWLAWVPPVLLATAVVWVGALTVRYDLPAGFEWPTYFEPLHPLAWTAVAVAAVLAWRPVDDVDDIHREVTPL